MLPPWMRRAHREALLSFCGARLEWSSPPECNAGEHPGSAGIPLYFSAAGAQSLWRDRAHFFLQGRYCRQQIHALSHETALGSAALHAASGSGWGLIDCQTF